MTTEPEWVRIFRGSRRARFLRQLAIAATGAPVGAIGGVLWLGSAWASVPTATLGAMTICVGIWFAVELVGELIVRRLKKHGGTEWHD